MDPVPKIVDKKPHVVFIPFPTQSHIKCMLKLARLLHQNGIYITFINTHTNHKRLVDSAGLEEAPDDGVKPTEAITEIVASLATNFFDCFLDVASGLENPITCMVCDGFMTFNKAIDAAEKLKVPVMLFWTMAACGFMDFYQVKVLTEKEIIPLKGMEGIRLKDLPEFTLATSSDDPMFRFFMGLAQEAHKVSHMIIHTFEELEARLVGEIKSILPNVYTIGPLSSWLKTKEPNSVVYVNFGSLAIMSEQDLLEFGWGLVNSNHYFLWIIRTDLVDGKPSVLPQELEARGNKQERVYRKLVFTGRGVESPGGWWEWEVGMEISRNVKRDEVEKLVRALMEGLEGERMMKKALEWKKMAEITTDSNGWSRLDTKNLADEINRLSRN
ncbi:hypothetical protein Hanom_Chr03g00253771 [Helianthus anomalus]